MSETNQTDNSAIATEATDSDAATSGGNAPDASQVVESQTTEPNKAADTGQLSDVSGVPESWTLKEQLAKTSISETWNVFDRARKKKLLLKRVSLDVLGDGGVSRFTNAITIQENITSPLFLKPLHYGSGGGWCWFARETTGNNKSLNEWVVGGKLMRPFELSKRFAVIAAVIAEIHQLGLVHGAIKPTNFFLVGTDSALLCDIDAAGLYNPTVLSPEQIAAAGRNEFLAPEQRGNQFDTRCDIWALAATAVYAATGLTPDKFDPQRLHQEIRDTLVRALAENPDDRFATIDDFRSALLDAVKVAKPTLFTDESVKPTASQAAPVTSPAQPRAAAPDPSVVQNNVNAFCPQCKTPVAGQLRACPKCSRPYEEPCLNCNALNPFWLPKCRACGADVVALKQKTVAGLIQQQQYVMGLRKACGHDKALPILKMMSLMVHPDFFNYREWAKSMIPIVQKERRDLRAYIDQVKSQAKATFDAQKYDRVQAIIEKIPAPLLDEEMRKMHADAGECITEVESLIREIRNAISSKQYSTLLSCVQRYLELKAQDPEARSLQEKIEKLTTVTTQVGMKFRRIPSGKFYMGSHESDEFIRNNERPQHRVSITRSFLLGVYPVMQSEFQAVCEYNPSLVTDNPRCPVDNVTWYGAIEFCNLLSEKEELPPYYKLTRIKRKSNGMIERADVDVIGGCGYRLPTEAEWEYCCRAGSISPWCFGEQVMDVGQYAWYFDNSHMETHPVGERKPNAWGLYDMHGNVMEWCYDYYEEFYYQRCTEEENPPGPEEGSTRVIRGGAWQFGAEATRCPYRNSYNPETASSVIGLRIMRDLEEEQTTEQSAADAAVTETPTPTEAATPAPATAATIPAT